MGINAFQNLGETTRLVNMLQPKDINNAAQTSTAVNMANYEHASIVIPVGVHSGSTTITAEQCQDGAGTGAVPIGFDYFKSSATASDVLGARSAATSAGVATDGVTANIQYVLEIQASQLTAGYNWLRVKLSSPGAVSVVTAVIGVLTTGRYVGQPTSMPSALV